MKNFIFKSSLVLVFIITGCGLKEQNIQKNDIAFLKFNSSKSYEIILNDNAKFDLNTSKNISYQVKSGKNNIKAYEKGSLILEKDVFLAQDSTKIINLP